MQHKLVFFVIFSEYCITKMRTINPLQSNQINKNILTLVLILFTFVSFSQEYDDLYFNKNDRKTIVQKNNLSAQEIINQYKNEEKTSKYKFKQLKSGIKLINDSYNLEDIINFCVEKYLEPEWGFPKGRRNYQERDMVCGLREFEEETGYDKNELINITNILPLEEIFTGSNYKSYKHKYFLGYINNTNEPKKEFQLFEISKIEWVNINEAEKYIRNYNIEKKKILIELNKLLKSYKLYI